MEDFDISALLLYLLSALLVQCYWLRRHIFGVFDPLLYFVVSSAFAMTLAALTVDSPVVLWRVFMYFACFWAGFTVSCGKAPSPLPARTIHVGNIDFFVRLVLVGAAMMIILNAIGWISRGIPLLSDNPSLAKVDSLTGGLGFIRRFNWGVGVFVLIGSLFWFLATRSAVSFAVMVIVCFMTALGGSKASLLPILFAAGLYGTRPFESTKITDFSRQLRRAFPIIGLLVIVPVFAVLLVENEGWQQVLNSLAIRLLYFGDVMLYWGQQDVRNTFAGLGPLDYPGHLLNGVTGFLRITRYDMPLGTTMVNATLDRFAEFDSAIGPNTPFYVKGEVFFGAFAAPLYAFAVGALFKWFRVQFFRYRGHSLTRYSVLVTVIVLAGSLPIEDSLFVAQLFDFVVFFPLIYLITSCSDALLPRSARIPGTKRRSRNAGITSPGH